MHHEAHRGFYTHIHTYISIFLPTDMVGDFMKPIYRGDFAHTEGTLHPLGTLQRENGLNKAPKGFSHI